MPAHWHHLSKRPGLLVAIRVGSAVAADLAARSEHVTLAEPADLERLALSQRRNLLLHHSPPWESEALYAPSPAGRIDRVAARPIVA